MALILRDPITRIWLLLLAISCCSWLVGTGMAGGFASAVFILSLAFFKIRLVILYFMEVRDAPVVLRIACDGWIIVLLISLLWLYHR